MITLVRFMVRKSVVLSMVLLSGVVNGAEPDAGADTWSNQLIIYLLGATLDGQVGLGPLEAEVDMGTSDIFDALDGAFLGMYRGEGERWGVLLDVVYMNLKADAQGPLGALSGTVSNKQTTVLASASYRVSENTRLLAGVLYADITAKARLDGPLESRQGKAGESWVDPVVGVLYNRALGSRWDLTGLAQVGGFGVGSDLTYVLTGSVAYQISARTSISLGYRYLDFDYEDGTGADRFLFDMKQHGPAVGFRFSF